MVPANIESLTRSDGRCYPHWVGVRPTLEVLAARLGVGLLQAHLRDERGHLGDELAALVRVGAPLQAPVDVALAPLRFALAERVERERVPAIQRFLRLHPALRRAAQLDQLHRAVIDMADLLAQDVGEA